MKNDTSVNIPSVVSATQMKFGRTQKIYLGY